MIIYQLTCNITGDVYFGSTTLTMNERIKSHRRGYARYKNGKPGKCQAYDIFDRDNFQFTVLEDLTNEGCDKEHLNKVEGWYIQNFECINKQIPKRTNKQYREDHKEYLKERRYAIIERERARDKIRNALKGECPICKKLFRVRYIKNHILRNHS